MSTATIPESKKKWDGLSSSQTVILESIFNTCDQIAESIQNAPSNVEKTHQS
jgi:hypothetical protein